MTDTLLRFHSLVTGYRRGRRFHIVGRDLQGSLQAGCLTLLAGVNGAGKSTLLRTLCGMQPAIGGSVEWLGQPLASYSARRLARTVAVVLTDRLQHTPLTAYETVALGRYPHTGLLGRLGTDDRRAISEALDLTGATPLAGRMMGSLSDGERQRIAIAKALAQETPAIMMDEPTAWLDFPGRMALLRLLCTLAHQTGRAIVMSTHDLELTLPMADRLWLLEGTALTEGSPQQLADRGDIERLFGAPGLRFDARSMHFTMQRAPSE